MGEELYNNLRGAYKALQNNSQGQAINYEQVIAQLKEVNANNTARILEQQQQMMKNTVPASTAKNMRSRNNTAQALREFLIGKDIQEAPAATSFGRVSTKLLFVIKSGKLYKRQNNKPDIDLENNSPAAINGLTGLDPIWTMIAVKHQLATGTAMAKNGIWRAEADALREGGKPLTHEEGEQLRNITAPKNDLNYPMGESTPKRDRTESLYANFSPRLETKKKVLKGGGLRAPRLSGAGHTSISVRYRELGGCLINLKALHGGKLSLRHGSNIKQMHGRVLDMSNELQDIVKTLVYDDKVDKEAYTQLTLDDKKRFDDLLRKSSLVYNEKNWDNPEEVLMEEYEKLVGEVSVGNDNPDIKKRLRKIITTMFASGIIKEKKFNDIMDQLI